MKIKLAIVDPDPVFARELSAEFDLVKEVEIIGTESHWERIERLISSGLPQVVIFGPGWARNRVISGFEALRAKFPAVAGVLVTAEYSTELRRLAADAGFAAVYGIPIDGTELLLCLRRVAATVRHSGEQVKSGRVITVFSTKGGVGKTVIATNLAIALAAERGAQTVAVDLDLQFGDVGVMLKLLPRHTLYDLVGLKTADLGQIRALLTSYNDKVSAFVAPLQPELADLLTPELVQPVFGWLRQLADYVIVDTPPCFNDNVLGVLDETDELHLVATLDLPSLKNIKLCLQTLKLLGFAREKIRLILNRVDKNLGLSVAEVEQVFQEKVAIQIPNDPAVPIAVNKGAPVVLDAPKSPATLALTRLAGLIGKPLVDKSGKEVADCVPA